MVESYSKNANHNMRRPVVKEEIVSFMRERQAPVTDALKELEEFARRENIPIIPHETVAFFRLFLQTMQPKSILEIGTAIGFSALLMAEQVPDAKIMTIDRNEEMIGFAKENFARFDQRKQITLLEGDAVDLLEHIEQRFDLIFMDFNCSDIFHEPIPNKNIIEIRHYQKGRVEFELRNNKVFHMKEGEFCINALANIPAAYSFPFGYSVGLSCVIDKDSVDVQTQQFFSYYNIDVLNLGRELELEKNWFLCRTPQRLLHIFDELYAAKGIEGRDYFRIKLLELFYHIKQLRIEDQYEATYYAKEQIEIIKRIRQQLIENLDKKIPIEELLQREPMSKVTFQAIFKQIYGETPYAHIKNYKMNLAAVYLQETDQSITQIAGELGYSNISKFARAFQEVFGMLPKDYRKVKKSN